MKTRLRVRLEQLTLMLAIGLFASGCPEKEEEPEPDAGEQTDVGDDTGSDAGMDADQDVTEDGGGETAATCVVDDVAPRTFSIEAADSAFSLTLLCDGEPTAEQFAGPLTFRRDREQSGAPELAVEGAECAAEGEFLSCTVGLSGLLQPAGTYDEVVGPEDLIIEDTSGQQFEARVHWHLPVAQLEGLQRERDMLLLPPGYVERGLEYAVKQTEAGRLVSGVMASADGTAVEMFTVAPDGSVSVDQTFNVSPDALAVSGVEIAQLGTGFGALWWARDSGGNFLGGQTVYTETGTVSDTATLDRSTYAGPGLTEMLGVEVGTAEVGGQIRMSARVLAKTDRNTVAVVRLADADGAERVSLETELDVLGETAVTELKPGVAGLLSSDWSSRDLDANRGNAWTVDQQGNVSLVPLTGGEAYTATLTGVQWPFHLELSQAFNRRIVARATSTDAGAEPQMYTLEAEGGVLTTNVCHLSPAPGVDLGGPGSFIEASDGAHHIHLGEMSGTGTPMIVKWDLSGSCADTQAPVTMVRPAVVEDPAAGIGAGSRDRALTGLNRDGTLQLVKADALRSACTDAAACAMPISQSTNNGWRVNLVPGETGATWAVDKYGDILIDGVPLVFDLTQPPIIVDAPGATAQDDAAMILAGIDHDSATHAVWQVSTRGTISEAGLLNLDTGNPDTGVVLTAAEGEDKGDDDEAQDMTLTIATVIIDFGADGDAGSDSGNKKAAGTFTVTASQLAASIGAADPVSFATEGPEFDVSQTTQGAVIAAPATAAPLALPGEDAHAEVLAELTPAQASRPLVFTYTDEGLFLRSGGDDGEPLDVLLEAEPVGGENPVFVDTAGGFPSVAQGDASGAGNGSGKSTVFTGKIKRIMIKKKRIGGNPNRSSDGSDEGGSAEQGEVTYQVVREELAMPAELARRELALMDQGDFNGDGLEDVVVAPTDGSGSTVLFSDGMGGLLPSVMPISGGPTIVWPSGATASTSSNGKGTTRAAALIRSNIHLELL
ncbi:MAG: hypothetical protein ACQEVA_10175 [Myxococcota bacterium]